MKKGWEYRKLENCLVKVPKQKELKTKDYKTFGQYPIVSQESTLISGYSDDIDKVFSHVKPVIIFGDHTKNVKYIDFDFVVGADGVKILMPQDDIISKFFYYVIKSFRLDNLGYARHYRLLKENIVPVPPLSEQKRIVSYLDSAFAKIDAVAKNAEDSLNEAKALFQSALAKMMEPKEGWEEKNLIDELALKSGDYLPSKKQKGGSIPVYGGNGITGYHQEGNLFGEHIVIGRVGALCGNVHLTNGEVWVTDNAFVVTGDSDSSWNKRFLSYELISKDLNKYATKAAQPVISNKSMRNIKLFKPSLDIQREISKTLDIMESNISSLTANLSLTLTECTALKQAILRQTFE
jgi:type I restriction enzyme S subunit